MTNLSEIIVNVWPAIWLSDFLRYAIAASVLSVGLYLFSTWAKSRKIQARTATYKDKRREVLYSLSTITIFSLVGLTLFVFRDTGLFHLYLETPSVSVVLVEFIAIVLLHDAYFYLVHRAMHHRLLYKRFHHVHHLSNTPTPWAAYAFAPAEAIVEAAILPIVAMLMPISALSVFLFTSHMIIRNVIGHAGVELFPRRWLQWPILRWITTTTHHDLHHAQFKSNFGLYFVWWDKIFGTEHSAYAEHFNKNTGNKPSKTYSFKGVEMALLLVASFATMTLFSTTANASEMDEKSQDFSVLTGEWVTPNFSSIVSISDCDDQLCGTIVWLWESNSGERLQDTRHPDHSRRNDPLIGRNLFSGFNFINKLWRGKIYNPEDGRFYKAKIKLLNSDILELSGCWGPFCQTQQWRRKTSIPCVGVGS